MTLFFHELRKNRASLVIWTAALSFMLGVCILIYPEMSSQMNEISDMFADMGSFSSAFGMDQVNFGEFMGYFAIECGNVLGLGGALFAALIGISAISCEERDGTAEFLLVHPLSRGAIVTNKLAALVVRVLFLNVVVAVITVLCIFAVGVDADFGKLALIFLSYVILQIEIGAVTFGISAFVRGGAVGIGLGIGFAFYFVNILANLDERLDILKYVTPFSYADGTSIVANGSLELEYLAVGAVFTAAGIASAYVKYSKKDIV